MSPLANSDTKAYSQVTVETTTAGTASTYSPVDDLEFIAHLPAGEIHRRALLARKLQGRTHHMLAWILLEMDERKLYRDLGCSSVYMYAELHLHLEGHTVAEYLRTGRSLRSFPLLADAYREGAISACKVREITRVATKETEPYWLEIARTHTYRQIEKMVVFSPRRNSSPAREEPHQSRGAFASSPLTQSNPAPLCPESRPSVPQASLQEPDKPCTAHPSYPASAAPSYEPAYQVLLPGFNDEGLQQSLPDPTAGSCHPLHCQASGGALPDLSHTECITSSCEDGAHQPLQGHYEPDARKYLEKMVLELSAEQAALIHDALRKARKESGDRDRASLFTHMARRFLDKGQESLGGISKKPPYQVVIHHYPGTGVTWTESAHGPVYMPPAAFDRALCDAEIMDIPAPMQEIKAESMQRKPVPAGGDERPETTVEEVNRLYQVYRDRGGAKTGEEAGKRKRRRTGTIPPALRKKVLLRDGGRCQVPGCGRSHHVEVHHLMPLGAGGDHRPEGLLVLCSGCHRNVHEGRLVIEGHAPSRGQSGRLIFRRL